MASLIDSYLDALERDLDFDPRLARRVRTECADHLAEAIADQGHLPAEAAERRAIIRLGPHRAIAASFALDTLGRRADRLWLAILTTFLATFLAMRLRTLGLAEPAESTAGLLAPLFDRYGFIAALVIGCGGWLSLRRHHGADRFRTVSLVAAATLAALGISIGAGLVRVASAGEPNLALVAVMAGSLAECGLIAWLMAQIQALRRQLRRAESLMAG